MVEEESEVEKKSGERLTLGLVGEVELIHDPPHQLG